MASSIQEILKMHRPSLRQQVGGIAQNMASRLRGEKPEPEDTTIRDLLIKQHLAETSAQRKADAERIQTEADLQSIRDMISGGQSSVTDQPVTIPAKPVTYDGTGSVTPPSAPTQDDTGIHPEAGAYRSVWLQIKPEDRQYYMGEPEYGKYKNMPYLTGMKPKLSPEGELEMDRRKEEAKLLMKERIGEQSTQQKAKRDLDLYSSDAMQALVAIDKIEAEAKNLGDFGRGVGNQLVSRIGTGWNKFGQEEKITKYLGVVAQELIPMARKLMEEKGPITESDVERVQEGLGLVTAPLQTKLDLLDELKNKVRLAITNKMQVAGVSQEEFNQKYSELANKIGNVGENQISPEEQAIIDEIAAIDAELSGQGV